MSFWQSLRQSLMLNCREVSELLSASLDRRLKLRERFALRQHLKLCRDCSNFSKSIRVLEQAFRNWLRGSSSERLSPEARDRIRQELERRSGRNS